jgi:hypothetical protein
MRRKSDPPSTPAAPAISLAGFVAFLLVLLVAAGPRVLDLGRFVTHDEAEFWIDRSEVFLTALQSGDAAATAISTHPGITTMWLGSVGIVLRRLLRAWGVVDEVRFPLLLALMQLPVALVHTLGIVVGYGMLRRLLSPAVAILAALLWAADPFIIGYSRLLHVDMLMGTFATLSLLAACLSWLPPGPARLYRWLLLSGVCTGLAMLSKSPALALLPVIGLLALGQGRGSRGQGIGARGQGPGVSGWSIPGRVIRLLVWGITAVLTVVVCWPAVWAAPERVVELVRVGVEVEGGNPHMTGNFFLGQEDPAPGPLFYPVALALRSTPLTLVGLLLLPWAAWSVWKRGEQGVNLRFLAVLAGFILVLAGGLTLFPKKFNRYLVPAFPALDVLAAVGLAWGVERLIPLLLRVLWRVARIPPPRSPRLLQQARVAGVSLVALAALLNAALWHPYAITAFNQVLGGAPTGARTFSVGWGEGLDQVAVWLNHQPDITGVVTAAIMMKTLNPYLRHGAQATTPRDPHLPDKTGYVVVYIYQAQGTIFPPFNQFYGRVSPLHTVTIHGVDYAWIYQVPPPVAHERRAQFGSFLALRGFSPEGEATRGHPLVLRLHWQIVGPPPGPVWMFAHLLGPENRRYAQGDWPALTGRDVGNSDSSNSNNTGRFVTTRLAVDIPADAPAGDYRLVIGLYDLASGERLPLSGAPAVGEMQAGPHALLLMGVAVPE